MTDPRPLDLDAFDAPAPDDRGALRFRRERDVSAVLNATFAFLRETGRELGAGLLTIAGPLVLVSAVASALFQRRFMPGGWLDPTAGESPDAVFGEMAAMFTSPLYYVSVALGLLTPLLVTAVVMAYVRLYREGEAGAITPGVLWAETRAVLGPVALVSAAVFAAFVATALLNVIPCLGTLAWVAGLVWSVPVVALMMVARTQGEAGSVGEAFRRARALVKGDWLQTFAALFICALIVVALASAVSIPVAVLQAALGLHTLGDGSVLAWGVTLIAAAVGLLVYLFVAIPQVAAAFLYFGLAEGLDGGALRRQVDALRTGSAPPAEPPPLPPVWTPPAPTAATPPPAAPDGDLGPPPPSPPPARPAEPPRGFRGGGFADEPDGRS